MMLLVDAGGLHLRGQPLCHQLEDLGARFLKTCKSSPGEGASESRCGWHVMPTEPCQGNCKCQTQVGCGLLYVENVIIKETGMP